ncbi:MAG: GNAT family N-acetyltransferase [Acidimicrobiia bacterium]
MEWTPPEPPLRTDDVVLRLLRPDDAAAVALACTDQAIGQFTFMKEGLTLDEARRWIDHATEGWKTSAPRFAIVDAATDRFLGQVGMSVHEQNQSAEMFYWVAAPERGRGVATTALGLVSEWAFANGVERAYLVVAPENEASHRVATRCGFTREGTLRGYERFKGRRPDVVSWSLLSTDARPRHHA